MKRINGFTRDSTVSQTPKRNLVGSGLIGNENDHVPGELGCQRDLSTVSTRTLFLVNKRNSIHSFINLARRLLNFCLVNTLRELDSEKENVTT